MTKPAPGCLCFVLVVTLWAGAAHGKDDLLWTRPRSATGGPSNNSRVEPSSAQPAISKRVAATLDALAQGVRSRRPPIRGIPDDEDTKTPLAVVPSDDVAPASTLPPKPAGKRREMAVTRRRPSTKQPMPNIPPEPLSRESQTLLAPAELPELTENVSDVAPERLGKFERAVQAAIETVPPDTAEIGRPTKVGPRSHGNSGLKISPPARRMSSETRRDQPRLETAQPVAPNRPRRLYLNPEPLEVHHEPTEDEAGVAYATDDPNPLRGQTLRLDRTAWVGDNPLR